METGVRTYPRPTTGTTEGATHIQTPSQAEHGLGGVFIFAPAYPRGPGPPLAQSLVHQKPRRFPGTDMAGERVLLFGREQPEADTER